MWSRARATLRTTLGALLPRSCSGCTTIARVMLWSFDYNQLCGWIWFEPVWTACCSGMADWRCHTVSISVARGHDWWLCHFVWACEQQLRAELLRACTEWRKKYSILWEHWCRYPGSAAQPNYVSMISVVLRLISASGNDLLVICECLALEYWLNYITSHDLTLQCCILQYIIWYYIILYYAMWYYSVQYTIVSYIIS